MWIYDSIYKNKPYKIYSTVQISVMYVYTYTYTVYFMIQKNNLVKVNFNWIPKVNYNFIISLTKCFKVILSSDRMQWEAGSDFRKVKGRTEELYYSCRWCFKKEVRYSHLQNEWMTAKAITCLNTAMAVTYTSVLLLQVTYCPKKP